MGVDSRSYIIGGLSAVLLVVASHSSLEAARRESLEETYTYNTDASPSTYTYTTLAPSTETFTYSGLAPSGQPTYTYNTMTGGEKGSYTYSGLLPTGGQTYTYNTVASPGGGNSYTAQPVAPYMTVINGYAQEPKKKQEAWYTVPVGTLHPTDRAGDWESGAFDSLNKDGTVAANAPLTLTGSTQRPEHAQPTDPTDHVGNRASVSYGVQARQQQLVAVSAHEKDTLWRTLVSSVKGMPAREQIAWAKDIVDRSDERWLLDTPLSAVHLLTPGNQILWAKAVKRNGGTVYSREPQHPHEWASHVLKLLKGSSFKNMAAQSEKHTTETEKSRPVKRALPPRVVKPRIEARHDRHARALLRETSAMKQRAILKRNAGSADDDGFGMPELHWAGEGAHLEKLGFWGVNLRSGRGCGKLCMRQATLSAQNLLPTD